MPKRNMKHWPWRRRWKNNKDKKVWFDAFKSHFIPKWDSELLLGVWEGPTSENIQSQSQGELRTEIYIPLFWTLIIWNTTVFSTVVWHSQISKSLAGCFSIITGNNTFVV
jgi:hypothetical protein